MKNNDKLEDAARAAIVEIAAQNNLYFVFWSGHFSRYFVALENKSKKNPDIYTAIYDQYYDVIGNDKEVFRFNIPQKTTWQEVLPFVKANVPIEKRL